jgi:hypothetical protein
MSEASKAFLRSLAIHVTCGSLEPPMQLSALPCSVHPGESDLIPGRIAFSSTPLSWLFSFSFVEILAVIDTDDPDPASVPSSY